MTDVSDKKGVAKAILEQFDSHDVNLMYERAMPDFVDFIREDETVRSKMYIVFPKELGEGVGNIIKRRIIKDELGFVRWEDRLKNVDVRGLALVRKDN